MILATATMFVLTAGAALAQSPLNTTAPGPTQQREPGQTNNDLPNPGNPIPTPQGTAPAPVTENGTVEGTATESIQQDQTGTTTGTTTGTSTGTTTGTMDSTTGGSMNDTTSGSMDTTDTTTGTTTGTSTSTSTSTTTTSGTSGSLPATGSELPLVGLIGLSALAGAVALRASRS